MDGWRRSSAIVASLLNMRSNRPDELLRGPFATATATRYGVTAKQLRGAGWRQVIHGVHVAAEIPDSIELRCASVRLVLPDDAVVGYTAAAWLHGADIRDRRKPAIEVIGQRGDQIRRAGLAASSALLEPEDVTSVFGVPVTTPVRTAFDLARRRDVIEAVVGLDAMLNKGGCRLEEIARYVTTHRRWRGVRYADAALTHAEPLAQSPVLTMTANRTRSAGATTWNDKSASGTKAGGTVDTRRCTSRPGGPRWFARSAARWSRQVGVPVPPIMHKGPIWMPCNRHFLHDRRKVSPWLRASGERTRRWQDARPGGA